MADKTTTLKTKTGDNVYPNVIGDNRKNAFVDSSTITHHFYDKTHKVGFQIANETNIKIQNSLQKPKGLTKTKLVGVGTNGQENIEIGDNLTLANGKLSATGGGGGLEYNVLSSSDYMTYDGEINIDKINLLIIGNIAYIVTMVHSGGRNEGAVAIYEYPIIQYLYLHDGEITITVFNLKYYSHFITITSSTSTFYFTYQNTSDEQLNTLDSLKTALTGKFLLCTGHTDSETAEYVSGERGNVIVGVVDNSDHSTSGITIDSSYTITDNVTPVE